ncbi:hypothetical protein SDC9_150413 [bioreactor metagenome]|uniref:Uncharacterized protein n=1 Tax=bioreactor metagenome TaxID=1076179 RepID=A0A645EMZ9_9ZZZZ
MFSTCVARAAKTVAEAARVAEPAFCVIPFQSTAGALPWKNVSIFNASSGLAFAQLAFAAYFSATIDSNSFARFAYNSATSGNITNGFSGFPPKLIIVFLYASPPRGAP